MTSALVPDLATGHERLARVRDLGKRVSHIASHVHGECPCMQVRGDSRDHKAYCTRCGKRVQYVSWTLALVHVDGEREPRWICETRLTKRAA